MFVELLQSPRLSSGYCKFPHLPTMTGAQWESEPHFYRCGSEMRIVWLLSGVAEIQTQVCMVFSLCQCNRLLPLG